MSVHSKPLFAALALAAACASPPGAKTLQQNAEAAMPENAVTLSGEALDKLLRNKTAYIRVPPGPFGGPEGGIATFFYGQDGRAAASLPVGLKLVGVWKTQTDRYCVDWDNGPKNSCTAIQKTGDRYDMVDPESGALRGQLEKIVGGNAESL